MAHKLTKQERNEYISIAKDLCYPPDIIERLERAQTDVEASNILTDARHHM